MSAYTEADIKAAARAIARRTLDGGSFMDYASAVLEAVGPTIAARALRDAASNVRGSDVLPDIPRSKVREFLTDRADEIEAKS